MGFDSKIIDAIITYGPFPVGIIVGILLDRWSMSKYFKSTESEKHSLREQVKESQNLIKSKNDRIDKLHDQIEKKSGGGKK